MGKTSQYNENTNPSLSHILFGSNDSKKNENISIQTIINVLSSVAGKDYIQYKFSPTDYASVGSFTTNISKTNPTEITKLFLNKQSVTKEDLTLMFNKLDTLQNIVISLRNPENTNNFATFKITNITNQTTYFEFDVVLYKSFSSGLLISGTTYSAYFDVKENFEDKVDKFSADIVVSLSNGKTAGKYTNGQTIPLIGKTPQEAFNDIFREPLFPTLVSPSLNALSFNKGSIQEAGATLTDLILTAVFNRGSITPQYSAVNAFRSGLPIQHLFTRPGGNTVTPNSSLNLSNTIASYVVALGTNNFTAQVNYDAGVQPKDNMGNNFDTPLVAGSSNILTATFQGIYPIFYSVSNTPPVANQALINTSTKSVLPSDGTLNIEFGAVGQYLWFAHPASMPTKTKWYVNALNNGNIGTISDLFNAPTTVNITTALWNGIAYKIYISNNPTTTTGNMELKNS